MISFHYKKTTPAVKLRQWYLCSDDEEAFRQLVQRADHRLTDGFFPEQYSDGCAYRWIKGMVDVTIFGDELHYAVEVDGKAVGCVNVSRCGGDYRHMVVLRLVLLPEVCGQGIGTQVVAEILKIIHRHHFDKYFVFDGCIERIESHLIGDNIAAKRVLEKNGFEYEGTRRSTICKEGKWYDESVYGYVFRHKISLEEESLPEDKNERIHVMQEKLREV